MTPFPADIGQPCGARRHASTPHQRDPGLLADVLGEHHFRGWARYRRRDITGDQVAETFCNVFTCDVAEALGVELPRARANSLLMWLASDAGRAAGWQHVEAGTAQRAADAGAFAVACYFNRNGGPGHVAVLAPSMGEAGVWVSNVGATNFLRGPLSSGFGVAQVEFFVHP